MADRTVGPVALVTVGGGYPATAPYHPDEAFPEYADRPIGAEPNPVYRAVRELFRHLGFDAARFGTRDWNPLAHVVRPGDRVFIKPNLVAHEHRAGGDLFSVITHPSVVRAVADYVALALGGSGEIVIGDNPSIDANFDRLLERAPFDALPPVYAAYFGTACRLLDLRPRVTRDLSGYGYKSCTSAQPGDPEGNSRLDLGAGSWFHGLDPRSLRGVFTDRRETVRHHSGKTHAYEISNTILNADAFVSVPKLKAHHKVGATVNIKGLVGINSNKNLLPHWRIGFAGHGGDEFPAPHRRLDPLRVAVMHALGDWLPEPLFLAGRRLVPRRVRRAFDRRIERPHEKYRGAWDGNDTCWRMAADLYAVFVQDRTEWRAQRVKSPMRFLSVVDGVTAGEGDGPFSPSAVPARVLLGGEDLLLVDALAVRYMDFDMREVRYLASLLDEAAVDLTRLRVHSNLPGFEHCFQSDASFGRFRSPEGWPRLSKVWREEQAA
jgi:uncharacterized protein (DUF362 family)